jgi:hypothetical protein
LLYILDYLRTSLRKNPEEWVFVETIKNSGKIPSFINIFYHEPTDYVLFLLNLPKFNVENNIPPEIIYYITMLSNEEYEYELETTGGAFSPDMENLTQVHPESVIIKTLKYIKKLTIEDDNIARFEAFAEYVKNKVEGVEEDGEN